MVETAGGAPLYLLWMMLHGEAEEDVNGAEMERRWKQEVVKSYLTLPLRGGGLLG